MMIVLKNERKWVAVLCVLQRQLLFSARQNERNRTTGLSLEQVKMCNCQGTLQYSI